MRSNGRGGVWTRVAVATAIVVSVFGAVPAVARSAPASPAARFIETGTAIQSSRFEILPRRCPKAGPIGETEGNTYACGILQVPEDYDDPEGRTIQIAFELFLSRSLSPAPDPVVYLEGGPGGSALEGAAFWAASFDGFRRTRDIILFDQRGTKYSGRIDCSPYLLTLNYLMRTDEEVQEIFADLADTEGDQVASEVQTQTYFGACAQGLAENGVDLSQYNSAVSARDIESLMTALGYDTYNLYGVSYGTRLALTMMRDRPEGIRSVVLDSTYPPEVNGYDLMSTQLHEAVSNLIANCEANRRCSRAFPELADRLDQVLEDYEDDELEMRLLVNVLAQINVDPRVPPFIPRMIYELSEGSTATMEGIVSETIFEGNEDEIENPELNEAQELLLTASELQQEAVELLIDAAEEEQAQRPGALWFTAFFEALSELTDEEEQTLALVGTLILPGLSSAPDRDLLKGLVVAFIPEQQQAPLLGDVDDLEDEEVQFIYDLITDVADSVTQSSLTDGMYYAVECFEEVPFNDPRESERVRRQLRYPALAGDFPALVSQTFAICDVFPSGTARKIETQPVESDIPTLVLSGEYDIQTPASWGELAAQSLSNSFYLEFPNAGHGVIVFSQCAQDVATAFINSPTIEPRSDCREPLETKFVTEPA